MDGGVMVSKIKGDATSTFGGEIKTNNDSIISNRPIVSVTMSSSQTVTDNVATKVQFDTVQIDTDSAYDETTNYRFTVPSGKAGKYMINSMIKVDDGSTNVYNGMIHIYKNGSVVRREYTNFAGAKITGVGLTVNAILDLSVGDYIEIYGQLNTVDNSTGSIVSGVYSWFDIHKLIG